MKAIIIMPVLAYTDWPKDFFYGHWRAAKETWDSVPHPNVRVIYLVGTDDHAHLDGDNLFMLADRNGPEPKWPNDGQCGIYTELEFVHANLEYDFLIMTTASSYWHKARLCEKLLTLPKRGCAASYGDGFLSGAGIVMSRDVVAYLISHYDEFDHKTFGDHAISRVVLKPHKQIPLDRMEFNYPNEVTPDKVAKHYQFRCRASGDRRMDTAIMRTVHRMIKEHGRD